MDWNQLIAEMLRRSWTLTIEPAYMLNGIQGTRIQLYDFDPDGTEDVLEQIIRIDEGHQHATPDAVLAATLRLCRELDPKLG